MGKEIERKFLVDLTRVNLNPFKTTDIQQGYLTDDGKKVIRIRIEDDKAFITIKGKTEGISRDEFEYEIPHADGIQLIGMCKKTITKKRTTIYFSEKYWTVDVFSGANQGLVIAEIELKDEKEYFAIPPWTIKEVSEESKYYNSNLIKKPYKRWKIKE